MPLRTALGRSKKRMEGLTTRSGQGVSIMTHQKTILWDVNTGAL